MLRDEGAPVADPGHGMDRFLYAGGLDRTTRNPAYMLDVLARQTGATPGEFHIYSYGNCEDQVRDERYARFVRAHGRVSPDEAISAMRRVDFLVTQGNDSRAVTPSKIFDCMSTGLPIVHFYYRDDDPYLEYLRKYGLGHAILIGSDEAEAAESLGRFVDARNRRVEYAAVARTFPECTPEHFCSMLRDQGPKGGSSD